MASLSNSNSVASSQMALLKQRHLAVMDMELAGLSVGEIAQRAGMTPANVRYIRKQGVYQDALARRRRDVEQKQNDLAAAAPQKTQDLINQHAEEAAHKLIDLMRQSESETIKFKSAKEIIDRTLGSGPQERPVNINIESIQVLQQAWKESEGFD